MYDFAGETILILTVLSIIAAILFAFIFRSVDREMDL